VRRYRGSIEFERDYEDEGRMIRVVIRNGMHAVGNTGDFEVCKIFFDPLTPFDNVSPFQ